MRDYDDYEDDNIRLYTPVFQRVMILTAVIIAVPVVMWTITTFVRGYVARPKVPALEHVASTSASVPIAAAVMAPPSTAPSSQPAPTSQTAPQSDQAATSEPPNPPADLKKGTPTLAALSDSPTASASPTASVSPTASAAVNDSASLQSVPVQASAPASASPPAAPLVDTANAAVPTASLPRSSATPRSTDKAASSGATASADRSIAWPNPNSASPPSFAASRLSPSPAPPSPPPARMAAIETVPADEPVFGRVPLPRQRPGHFAVASSGPTSGGAMPASVPLPRLRPSGAPAEAATTFETPISGRAELENAH